MKKSLLIGMFLFIAACGPDSAFKANPTFMRHLPDGNDSYSIGFRDGCTTFMGIIGTGPTQFNSYSIDTMRVLEDAQYAKGVNDGRAYCTHYLDPAVT